MRGYPHEFSGGMRQRVLIAMALASRPQVLLADEPTTALDVLIQDQILSLLLELQRDFGMSMILVSHDLGVIGEMCDRVAVMYAGQIVELTDTETLLQSPRHPYTISLLRSLPDMNAQTRYLRPIAGAPPALIDIPDGCRFAPRCPLAIDECRTWETRLEQIPGREHTARCLRHDETAREDAWPERSYESE
jgi:peptide/nickel transport system ATP-binding protein/oligopeptide transport system ATP-binding protein